MRQVCVFPYSVGFRGIPRDSLGFWGTVRDSLTAPSPAQGHQRMNWPLNVTSNDWKRLSSIQVSLRFTTAIYLRLILWDSLGFSGILWDSQRFFNPHGHSVSNTSEETQISTEEKGEGKREREIDGPGLISDRFQPMRAVDFYGSDGKGLIRSCPSSST